MKILALSNFYPPHHVSGYAMLCFDVLEALRTRGHEITVITGRLGHPRATVEGHVHRVLTLESPLDYYRPLQGLCYPIADQHNLRYLRRLIVRTRPDIVFIWGMWNLSKRLAALAERQAGPRVVYYLANPWPVEANSHVAYWSLPTRRQSLSWVKAGMRLVARLVLRSEWRPAALQFEHVPCCSQALREQLTASGVPLKNAPIIYEGIDVDSYVRAAADRKPPVPDGVLSIAYVGLLVEHKGVHTAVEALARLPRETLRRVRLSILGSGHPDYESRLRTLVETTNLTTHVTFVHPIPRTDLPRFLAAHHVLLLPSIWEEPLALIMQEALASGLVLVGSATGGTKEIIKDGANGLLFPAGDADCLARHIQRVASDVETCRSLGERGRETAQEKFALTRMVNDLEAYLASVDASAPPH